MQLKPRILIVGATFFVAALFLSFGSIRFVPENSPDLKMIPFGYSYKGGQFTGAIFSFSDWKLSRLTLIWSGLRHGPDIQWYPNGQRFIERHYRYGKEFGTHKAWYENGRVKSLKVFKAGVPDGEFFDWHPNGQVAQFVVFKAGREVAAKSWTSGGKPFFNYVWSDQKTIGLQGDSFCSPPRI